MKIPNRYEDLTYTHYLQLVKWDRIDYAELVQLWTGSDYDDCMSFIDTLPADYFDFLNDIHLKLNSEQVKNKILGCSVPNDLMIEIFGKKLSINQIVTKINHSKDREMAIIEELPTVLAIVLNDRYFGKYDSSKNNILIDKLKNEPISVIYPAAMFFFRKLID